jgi:hypothetical protein
LELAFANKALRNICESQLIAERELGMEVATSLRTRLADLHAARTIEDLVFPKPEATSDGHMALRLIGASRLIFAANHVASPVNRKGDVNWVKVKRIKLLKIDPAP